MTAHPINLRGTKSTCTVFVLALLFALGCSNPVSNIPELTPERLAGKPAALQAPPEKTYKMVPYDVINVRFTYHPESDPKMPVSIRPDGQIMLDGVGSIRAAGLTPEELGKEIAAKSSSRLKNPEVVVTINQFTPRKIFVGGQVKDSWNRTVSGRDDSYSSYLRSGWVYTRGADR